MTVNHTGAAKGYVFLLVMFSASDNSGLQLQCNMHASIAPEPCAGAGAVDDSCEPNQSQNKTPATPGTYPNRFVTSSNDDWYRVLVASGATLSAQIAIVNAAGDLDLAVGGDSSNSTNDIESASFTNISPFVQLIDVRVHAKDGQFSVCNNYDLALGIANPAIGTSYCVGAANSTGFGAFLMAQGSTSVSANAMTFVGSGLPPNAPALSYEGTSQTQTPFGDGFRCVGGSTHRIRTVSASSYGMAHYPIDFGALPPPAVISPGSTWKFQVYYRNFAGPGGTGFTLSNGLSVTFQP